MRLSQTQFIEKRSIGSAILTVITLGGILCFPLNGQAQVVRTKKPDRDIYQPAGRPEPPVSRIQAVFDEPVFDDELPEIRPVQYLLEQPDFGPEATCGMEATCGIEPCCDGGCDSMGFGNACDAGCASLACDPCRWFGSMELMLMFRSGDRILPLITTGPVADGGNAGEIGQPNTQVLAGNERIFNDLTAGGRLTIGTWLDNGHRQSLVGRFWSATEADYDRSVSSGIISIPFFDANAGANDVTLIAFPDGQGGDLGRFGSASVTATSNVYGGDVSIRQFWTGGLGTTWDFLYGYQYMRLDESLQLSSQSTRTEGLPGSSIAVIDRFDTSNEFHGGEFGISGLYREGCWSFSLLAKTGFGQLNRRADLSGQTTISNGTPPSSIDDQGLFVRDTNSGKFSDRTFGWIPELDLALGWRRSPRSDVTLGYNIIAMTDALSVSGAMDRDGAVNTQFPTSGPARPSADFRHETFFVQSITFGVRFNY